MSRTVADATRFTATSPHAYSKPSAPRSAANNAFSPSAVPRGRPLPTGGRPSNPGSLGPKGPASQAETPAQKVARLRAQHDAQKLGQISTWDRVVVRGRIIADIAHRYTTLGLIGFSVVAGVVTIFSLGDMMLYNRRKRKVWWEEQKMLYKQKVIDAQDAAAKGVATDDQILFLDQERAADEAEELRKAKKGIWNTITTAFSTEKLREVDTADPLDVLGEEGLRKMGSETPIFEPVPSITEQTPPHQESHNKSTILEAVEEKRRDTERKLQKRGIKGGYLDKMAEDATAAASGKVRGGWTGWMTSK